MELKHIKLIGGEIEGGWNYSREDLEKDLGIRMDDFKNSTCCGEAVLRPPTSTVESAIAWIEANYKRTQSKPWDHKENNGIEVQNMTGTHWHFSFHKIEDYSALMSKKFHKYFIDYMTKWGEAYPVNNLEFWERLENNNKFCKNEFRPEQQIFVTKKINNDPGRYTQIHFAYGLYKTVEFRLLPTFVSLDTATSGFMALVDCVESYLEKNPPLPFDLSKELYCEENAHDETTVDLDNPAMKHPKFCKIEPFNLFMTKGVVGKSKYGLKELRKSAKKMEKRSVGYESNFNLDYGATKAINKPSLWQPSKDTVVFPMPAIEETISDSETKY